MTADRLHCLVPGCRRTTPAGRFSEWVCPKHWPAVSRDLRRRYARAKRRAVKDPRWARIAARLWVRCRQAAIEEAFMGVQL